MFSIKHRRKFTPQKRKTKLLKNKSTKKKKKVAGKRELIVKKIQRLNEELVL